MTDIEDRLRHSLHAHASRISADSLRPPPASGLTGRPRGRTGRGVLTAVVAVSVSVALAAVGYGLLPDSEELAVATSPTADPTYLADLPGYKLLSGQRVVDEPATGMLSVYRSGQPGQISLVAGARPTSGPTSTTLFGSKTVMLPVDYPKTDHVVAYFDDVVCGRIVVVVPRGFDLASTVGRVRCELVGGRPRATLDGEDDSELRWTEPFPSPGVSYVLRYQRASEGTTNDRRPVYFTVNLRRFSGDSSELSTRATIEGEERRQIGGRVVYSRLDTVILSGAGTEQRRFAETMFEPTVSVFVTMPHETTFDDVVTVLDSFHLVTPKVWAATLASLGVSTP